MKRLLFRTVPARVCQTEVPRLEFGSPYKVDNTRLSLDSMIYPLALEILKPSRIPKAQPYKP